MWEKQSGLMLGMQLDLHLDQMWGFALEIKLGLMLGVHLD